MRKSWVLSIDGQRHEVDVEWDLVTTSRGRAWVDGVEVGSWWSKVKFPGVSERVRVAGREITVRQTLGSFELDLRAAPDVTVAEGEPAAPSGSRAPWFMATLVAAVLLAVAIGFALTR